MSISINEAHSLLEQLKQQEISLGRAPDTWYTYENHVIGTAELAWLIASEIKEMNPDKLYVKGLLHDICRTEEDRKQRFHGILGYEKLIQKDSDVARACLLHMFLWNKLPPYQECHDLFYQKEEDYNFIAEYIINHNPSNEDYLIQLCDYLANKDGYVTIEQRAEELAARHRNTDIFSSVVYCNEIKQYFDKKIGHDIYHFYKTNVLGLITNKIYIR